MRTNILIIIVLLVLSVLKSQSLWNNQGHIDQDSRVDWTKAGLLDNSKK